MGGGLVKPIRLHPPRYIDRARTAGLQVAFSPDLLQAPRTHPLI